MTAHDRDVTGGSGVDRLRGDEQVDLARRTVSAAMREREIRPRVTPELIAEHRRRPIGRHSLDLELVLTYLRRAGGWIAPRYAVLCAPEPDRYVVGTSPPGAPASELEPVGGRVFDSLEDVEHWIFLRRLADLGLLDGAEAPPRHEGPGAGVAHA